MLLDYKKENEYLPPSTRQILKMKNRVTTQVDDTYIRMFDGYEQMVILNNYYASKIGSGFTENNYSNLMSGIAPRLNTILATKTIGRIKYIAKGEAEQVKNKFSEEYMTNKLYNAVYEAIRTGSSLMCVYNNNGVGSIENFNQFRHRVVYDSNDNIIQAEMYVRANDDGAYCRYIVAEERFYKNGKPYQRFSLTKLDWENLGSYDTKKTKYDKETMPKSLQEKYKNIVFYKDIELVGYTDLGVYPIINTLVNSKFPDSKISESRFVNVQDTILEIENGRTFKEIEKNLGRARALVPTMFNTAQGLNGATRMARNISNPLDKTIFTPYETNNMQQSKVEQMQFDIRADQWRTSIEGDIGDICASFGISVLDYDPRLLQQGQRTDDEINAMTDITIASVEDLRKINKVQINKMLATICNIYGFTKPLTISFGLSSILNPTKNTALLVQQLQAGLISQKEAIRRANPDFTDEEVEEQYNAIQEEMKVKSLTTNFNEF